MGGGLIAVDQRASDGGPVLEPGEEGEPGEVLLHSQPDVGLVLGESDVDESGNLYITSKRVVWHSTHTPHGVAVSLVDLSMHAISRDLDAYPKPCIYTQVGGCVGACWYCHLTVGSQPGRSDHLSMHAISRDLEAYLKPCIYTQLCVCVEPESPPREEAALDAIFRALCDSAALNPCFSSLYLLPPPILPSHAVDAIFKALCDSAALNPDPEGAEQEGEGDWYYNEDEVLSNARVVLPEGDPDQFEDADEDEDEEEGAGAAAGS
ncbi:unnamed protein product [Closterium sp. NIES-65]|nr:unnamed protein product [Closterium sp. NIES-65]